MGCVRRELEGLGETGGGSKRLLEYSPGIMGPKAEQLPLVAEAEWRESTTDVKK